MVLSHCWRAVDIALRVRLHGGMAKSQWRFEPIIWGAPETDEDRKTRNDRGGIGFDVLSAESGEYITSLELNWLAEPDKLGATMEFVLVSWADNNMHTFPAWIASGRLIPRPGGVVMSQLSINPEAPGMPGVVGDESDYEGPGKPPPKNWVPDGGITSGLLRKLPLGIVFAGVQALMQEQPDSPELKELLDDIASTMPDFNAAIEETAGADSSKRRKGGRPGMPDEYLREVALAYLELSGQRGAHALLSKRFNRSPDAIKESIRAARRAGWLAPGQAGRRGAYPGPRLLAEIPMEPIREGATPGVDRSFTDEEMEQQPGPREA
jgi:hypothetical protein